MRGSQRFVLAGVALGLLGLCPSGVRPAPVYALGERLVLAFYYAWYDQATWQNPLPDQPLYPYVSSDPVAIERHVRWAQQAGIDGFVQSWYGPQVEGNQTEPNFALLLDIAGRHGFSAAVDLEVTSPFIHSQADLVAALQHVLTVHARHPAYLRVGGRPVIFFWRQDRYPVEAWQALREQIDPQHLSIWIAEGVNLDMLGPFDGTHLYSVAWDPNPGATLRRWGERIRVWNGAHGSVRYWVATVMPGYNDLVTGRPDAFVRDRADGAYYRNCWEGAIQSGADWVIITSFNEWMEGSQIEPGVAYGEFYLDLTRQMADLYRASEPLPPEVPPTIIVNPTAMAELSSSKEAGSMGGIEEAFPTAVPSPSPTATATLTPTFTPTPVPTPSPSPTVSPTAAPVFPAVPASPTPTAFVISTPSGQFLSVVWANLGYIAGGVALILMVLVTLRSRRR